jgi:glycosyltransferase involved in cell wall biosynthesis
VSAPAWWIVSDAPYAGGAEQYLQWLLRAAPGEVGLLAVEREGLRPWIERQREAGVVVQTVEASTWWREALALRAWARSLRPACVHVNLPGPYDGVRALAPWALRRGGARRVVVTEHLPTVGRVGKRYFIKRLTVNATDTAITVCERHRRFAVDTFGYRDRQVVAIVNGVPDPNPRAAIAAERRGPWPEDLLALEASDTVRIVQVGALDPRKGGDDLIRAVDILDRRKRNVSLWMLGEGPAREAWRVLARERGVASRVHWLGHRDDVHAILAGCDVAALASHREGMPLSLLEACAHGLPIVATNVDGNVEVVDPGRTGRLVDDGDVFGLAAALEELAADPSQRARFGRNARRRYERRFTLARMIEQTFAQYGGARD